MKFNISFNFCITQILNIDFGCDSKGVRILKGCIKYTCNFNIYMLDLLKLLIALP